MTRSIGDMAAESVGVTAEPELKFFPNLSPSDKFIVLASDGIWDVINNEEIQQYINYRLKMTQNLAEICKDIINICIERVFIIFSIIFF